MTNKILTAVGILSLALGIVGIFLPLMPTTPFLILAALCFSKGNKQLHSRLMNHKNLGPILKDWEENRVIRKSAKVVALSMLAFSSVMVFLFAAVPLWARVSAVVTMATVASFILFQKSK